MPRKKEIRQQELSERFGANANLNNGDAEEQFSQQDVDDYNDINIDIPDGFTPEMVALIQFGAALDPELLRGEMLGDPVSDQEEDIIAANQRFVGEHFTQSDDDSAQLGKVMSGSRLKLKEILDAYKNNDPAPMNKALQNASDHLAKQGKREFYITDDEAVNEGTPQREFYSAMEEIQKKPGVKVTMSEEERARLRVNSSLAEAEHKLEEIKEKLTGDNAPAPDSNERRDLLQDYLFYKGVINTVAASKRDARNEAENDFKSFLKDYKDLEKHTKDDDVRGKRKVTDPVTDDQMFKAVLKRGREEDANSTERRIVNLYDEMVETKSGSFSAVEGVLAEEDGLEKLRSMYVVNGSYQKQRQKDKKGNEVQGEQDLMKNILGYEALMKTADPGELAEKLEDFDKFNLSGVKGVAVPTENANRLSGASSTTNTRYVALKNELDSSLQSNYAMESTLYECIDELSASHRLTLRKGTHKSRELEDVKEKANQLYILTQNTKEPRMDDPAYADSVMDTLESSMKYAFIKQIDANPDSPDWEPSSKMGKRHLKAARKLNEEMKTAILSACAANANVKLTPEQLKIEQERPAATSSMCSDLLRRTKPKKEGQNSPELNDVRIKTQELQAMMQGVQVPPPIMTNPKIAAKVLELNEFSNYYILKKRMDAGVSPDNQYYIPNTARGKENYEAVLGIQKYCKELIGAGVALGRQKQIEEPELQQEQPIQQPAPQEQPNADNVLALARHSHEQSRQALMNALENRQDTALSADLVNESAAFAAVFTTHRKMKNDPQKYGANPSQADFNKLYQEEKQRLLADSVFKTTAAALTAGGLREKLNAAQNDANALQGEELFRTLGGDRLLSNAPPVMQEPQTQTNLRENNISQHRINFQPGFAMQMQPGLANPQQQMVFNQQQMQYNPQQQMAFNQQQMQYNPQQQMGFNQQQMLNNPQQVAVQQMPREKMSKLDQFAQDAFQAAGKELKDKTIDNDTYCARIVSIHNVRNLINKKPWARESVTAADFSRLVGQSTQQVKDSKAFENMIAAEKKEMLVNLAGEPNPNGPSGKALAVKFTQYHTAELKNQPRKSLSKDVILSNHVNSKKLDRVAAEELNQISLRSAEILNQPADSPEFRETIAEVIAVHTVQELYQKAGAERVSQQIYHNMVEQAKQNTLNHPAFRAMMDTYSPAEIAEFTKGDSKGKGLYDDLVQRVNADPQNQQEMPFTATHLREEEKRSYKQHRLIEKATKDLLKKQDKEYKKELENIEKKEKKASNPEEKKELQGNREFLNKKYAARTDAVLRTKEIYDLNEKSLDIKSFKRTADIIEIENLKDGSAFDTYYKSKKTEEVVEEMNRTGLSGLRGIDLHEGVMNKEKSDEKFNHAEIERDLQNTAKVQSQLVPLLEPKVAEQREKVVEALRSGGNVKSKMAEPIAKIMAYSMLRTQNEAVTAEEAEKYVNANWRDHLNHPIFTVMMNCNSAEKLAYLASNPDDDKLWDEYYAVINSMDKDEKFAQKYSGKIGTVEPEIKTSADLLAQRLIHETAADVIQTMRNPALTEVEKKDLITPLVFKLEAIQETAAHYNREIKRVGGEEKIRITETTFKATSKQYEKELGRDTEFNEWCSKQSAFQLANAVKATKPGTGSIGSKEIREMHKKRSEMIEHNRKEVERKQLPDHQIFDPERKGNREVSIRFTHGLNQNVESYSANAQNELNQAIEHNRAVDMDAPGSAKFFTRAIAGILGAQMAKNMLINDYQADGENLKSMKEQTQILNDDPEQIPQNLFNGLARSYQDGLKENQVFQGIMQKYSANEIIRVAKEPNLNNVADGKQLFNVMVKDLKKPIEKQNAVEYQQRQLKAPDKEGQNLGSKPQNQMGM